MTDHREARTLDAEDVSLPGQHTLLLPGKQQPRNRCDSERLHED